MRKMLSKLFGDDVSVGEMFRWTAVAVLFILVMLVTFGHNDAKADSVDELVNATPEEYCGIVSGIFYSGLANRFQGYARSIKQITGEEIEILEHGGKLPKDTMYSEYWDEYTPQERAFVQAYTFGGWDQMDKMMSRGIVLEEVVEITGQEFYDSCMSAHSVEGFKKMKSEGLIVSSKVQQQQCAVRQSVAQYVIQAARQGVPKDYFWQVHPTPDGWSTHMQNVVKKLVDEAYVWPRGEQDFVEYVRMECYAGRLD